MTNNTTDYGPSFRACSLYRRKSHRTGTTYFSGRRGGLRVTVVKRKETADDGAEIWSLLFSEAPKPKALPEGDHPVKPSTRNFDKQLDDEVPF